MDGTKRRRTRLTQPEICGQDGKAGGLRTDDSFPESSSGGTWPVPSAMAARPTSGSRPDGCHRGVNGVSVSMASFEGAADIAST